jgi:hypothetical protein
MKLPLSMIRDQRDDELPRPLALDVVRSETYTVTAIEEPLAARRTLWSQAD